MILHITQYGGVCTAQYRKKCPSYGNCSKSSMRHRSGENQASLVPVLLEQLVI